MFVNFNFKSDQSLNHAWLMCCPSNYDSYFILFNKKKID